MTGKEVRALKDEEIKLEIERSRAKLYQLRTQTVTEKVENTAQFKQVRRDIARLMTERQVRHLAKNGAKPVKAAKPAEAAAKPAPGKKKSTKPAAKKA